ncbi:unnamed protein product, partial [Dicrocoelium dendriticum]
MEHTTSFGPRVVPSTDFSTSRADLSIPDPAIRKSRNIPKVLLWFRSQLNFNLKLNRKSTVNFGWKCKC